MIFNPWNEMAFGSQRRATIVHDIFWIREELKGNYAIKFSLSNKHKEAFNIEDIKLKNIEIIKKENQSGSIEWFLLLKESSESDLFSRLCQDLIDSTQETPDEKSMIIIVVNRLKRWQKFLENNKDYKLAVEVQMGLFSELHALLYSVAREKSMKDSIYTWVGPEADKQDFIFKDSVLEVKSHRSTKKDIISISSPHQLYTVKEYLTLMVYALGMDEEGQTVADLIALIKERLILERNQEEIKTLESKIEKYGYFEIFHQENLTRFRVDRITFYEVNDAFPKVQINHIPNEISNLKYQIDLSQCRDFVMKDPFRILGERSELN
ncbi:PD-(D/E)XK motif protein [Exiguobacterium flavidum]|uniref:PD-(D/E)XK motif protein n=1 Tax=Exiguobacterium flavidum TaxID=2184695 RepID=UPI000DF80174|nr:PD-(D/E)XK motif protein [Exiguobacterium flavidum]